MKENYVILIMMKIQGVLTLCHLHPPPPPPPPPPPEVIEIVEDDIEIEEELVVIDADDEEDLFIEEESNPDPFMVVEQMPVFPCITTTLTILRRRWSFAYITKSIKYPSIAKENNITGTVYVQYIIDKKKCNR